MKEGITVATTFKEKVAAKEAKGKHLCIGLDPVREKIPKGMSVGQFLAQVVEATIDVAAAYKPNWSFIEALGASAWADFASIVGKIQHDDSEMPILGDAKRGDIGKTNHGSVRAFFDDFGVDAITVHPYLGQESLTPFLELEDRGVLVLCRTSNPGGGEFQNLMCNVSEDECLFGQRKEAPLYQVVAHRVAKHWSSEGSIGLVVGATYPEELGEVRKLAPQNLLLIPGVGTQGGDLVKSVQNASGGPYLINVSSGVSYAFLNDPYHGTMEEVAEAAESAARSFDDQIRQAIAA